MNLYAFEFRNNDPKTGKQIAEEAYRLSCKVNYRIGKGDYFQNLGVLFFEEDVDSCLFYLRKSISEYRALPGNELRLANSYLDIANGFIYFSDYDSTIYYARLAGTMVDEAKKKTKGEYISGKIWSLKAIGDAYYYKSRWDSSLSYFLKAGKLAHWSGNKAAVSGCLVNEANIYAELKDFKKATDNLLKALQIDKELNNHQSIVYDYTNLGNYFGYDHQYQKADLYIDSAITYGKKYDVSHYFPMNYMGLGTIETQKNNCEKALKYYRIGWKYAEESENEFTGYKLLVSLGEALSCLGKYQEALKYFQVALKQENDNPQSKAELYQGLAEIYGKTGNYKLAHHYLNAYNILRDSLLDEEKLTMIYGLNIKYETGQKEEQIELLSKETELRKALLEKAELRRLIFYVTAAVLLMLVILGFYSYIRRRAALNEKNVLKERLRIGRDLHDNMGATLSSISIYSLVVKQKLSESNIAQTSLMLDRISEDAREMVSEMSDMVWAISPFNDTIEKLFERIQVYAMGILSAKEITLVINVDEEIRYSKMPMDSRKNIFLICKEAINNAAKHSYAKIVKLNATMHKNHLTISISDDGVGIENNDRGNGLRNMRQRAKDISAEFILTSGNENGTHIILSYLLPKNGDK